MDKSTYLEGLDRSDALSLLTNVATIYAAPGSTNGWNDLIRSVADLTNSKAAAYVLVNSQTLVSEARVFTGFPERDREKYEGSAGAQRDIRFQYLHNLLPGKVFREFEFVPDRAAYDASEWIQYQRSSLGCYWCISAQVSTHGLWRDYLSCNRLETLGPHTDREKALLGALLPHISRAAELHRTLIRLADQYGAVLAAMDHLLVGLVIVDASFRVAAANVSARAACEATGAVAITRDGRLTASDPGQDANLRALISDCIGTANGEQLDDGGTAMLTRADRAVLAEVMPLRGENLADGERIRGAAVFLIDPTVSKVVSLDGLAQVFALTASESQVVQALVNGLSTGDIAEARGTSLHTVRTQLKAALAKTGATSQLDLLRLATKLSPPVRDRRQD
jgi:DNA-binding CsgD family transcriptional regulator